MSRISRFDQSARRSRVVVADGPTVYLAGQVADDKGGDISEQTQQALAKVDQMLQLAGSSKSKLLSVQIWLADMADYDGMNAVWDAWVVPGMTPARSCGQVKLADPGLRVEIIAIAQAPDKQ
jgi:enamine deaminase RidA (YjgF/YER057c/UK114 family)